VINNNEINLAFAKGILVERKRWDVCWAQFANCNDILVEDEVVLSSLEAELACMDWAILVVEKHVHFTLTQW
jgi:hypothetical protein